MEQVDPPHSPRETLPTMYDLPSEAPEEAGLPDEFHLWQAELCSATFQPPNYSADQVFVASDLNLYYDPLHTGWYKRPDWFAVVGVPRLYEDKELRLSYVMWQEGVRPVVAIEFLSPSTRNEDLGQAKAKGPQPTKWDVYETILGIPYYIIFDRYTDELQAFQMDGERYRKREVNELRFWLPTLRLGIGLWEGMYRGLKRRWLRWYDESGNWIPTEAERERQRADRLAERLRQAGINPEEVL
ncbi:MAG: Uma2 family endonuclease [Cyanothece sp. SIO1E1]|nr:Uma2 family endonuclease [Cyanothece sp. SIO1E1]